MVLSCWLVGWCLATLFNQPHRTFATCSTPFFLKSGLTALDLYVFMLVSFFPEREKLLSGRPHLDRLVQVVANRKSVQRVLPRHGL